MWGALGVLALLAFAAPASAQDPKVEKGKAVYTAQKCSLCHSIEGKGNKKGALDSVGTKLTAAQLHDWIVDPEGMTVKAKAERKPPMKKKVLPAEDVEALVAYLATLKK
jgi:mono/diheme cytochrome c family protein